MDKPETKANEEWTSQRQRQMKNGQARDKGKGRMDKPGTKAILDTQDTPRRQTKHKNTPQR